MAPRPPFAPPPRSPTVCPTAALIGEVGAGKTFLFNKVCGTKRKSRDGKSITKQYTSAKIHYPSPERPGTNLEMKLFDGPGSDSVEETYYHSWVIRHELEAEPLNGIFVVVPYNKRYDKIPPEFEDASAMLKEEHRHLRVAVVTMMDEFAPNVQHSTEASMEAAIRSEFRKYNIDRVVFSKKETDKKDLFHKMRTAIADKPAVSVKYTEAEFIQHFKQQDRRMAEQESFRQARTQVDKLQNEYEKGLQRLVTARNNKAIQDTEFEEFVFASIRQHNAEIEDNVLKPFWQKHGENEIEFNDYTCYLELQKLAMQSHKKFRDNAKAHLRVDPDDAQDWRNSIRRCPYCRRAWVKVEGCDDGTTCGSVPSRGDTIKGSFVNYVWQRVNGILTWSKSNDTSAADSSGGPEAGDKTGVLLSGLLNHFGLGKGKGDGCGQSIVWKNMAPVPVEELEAIYSARDLMAILDAARNQQAFQPALQAQKRKVEVASAFVELGPDKADIPSLLNSEFVALYDETTTDDIKLVSQLKQEVRDFVEAFSREPEQVAAGVTQQAVEAFLMMLFHECGDEKHVRCLTKFTVDGIAKLKVRNEVVLGVEGHARLAACIDGLYLMAVERGSSPVAPAIKTDEVGAPYFEYDVKASDIIQAVSVTKYMARLWTCVSVSQWGDGLFSMLQKTIRKDDGLALQPAVRLIRCLNGLLCSVRTDPSGTLWPSQNVTYRGMTMPVASRAFFVTNKKYRVKMMLATSFEQVIAERFMAEGMQRNPQHIPVLFKFNFDPVKRCKHVFYIEEVTAARNEFEFLLAAYSAFKVRSVTPAADGPPHTPLIIELDVMPDNAEERHDLPLTSWA